MNYYSDYSSTILTVYIVAGIIGLIVSFFLGVLTQGINESKGYSGGFAWGFWLGIIGIIVVSCRQPNPYYSYQTESIIRAPAPVNEVPPPGGWKCICGKGHAAYESGCVCGRSKTEALQNAKKDTSEDQQSSKKDTSTSTDTISAIKEYKKLLDDGIITQEEFDAKKKQLLGL